MNIMLTGATGLFKGTHITNQAIANHIDHFHIGVRNVEKVPEDWRGNSFETIRLFKSRKHGSSI